jgi:capsular exopolysaccharide synthesis family protein
MFGGRRISETLIADSVDSVRAAITRGDKAQDIDSIVVTSAVGKEGKSTLASQLAVSFARSGKRTLLVDGDVRNPRQHLVFGVPVDRGLCEVFRGEIPIADAIQATPADNLWILPAGRYDMSTLHGLSGRSVGEIMEQLRSQYDFVIVDCGPVLTGPEPMIFGQYVSGAVLSCRQDFSSLEKIDEAQRRLRNIGIRILGAVINGAMAESRQTQLALPAH